MLKNKEPSLSSLGSDGNTSFLRAARAGHLDKVLEHLKSNIDINTSNANGLNALHLASKDGHVEVVAELLKRGAVVDAATKKGNTALHIASLAGQEEVVRLLVQHGASVNVQSQNGFTPLYMAAQENHDNVVKYLLANGANQSLATEDGFTPLAVAMQQGHDKVVAVLLESDTRGKVRLPALHIAAKKDDVKAAKLLLENEHNPDVTSKSGFTPLHIASHYGNESIANLLIQKGADVNYAAKHNITPLHVAAKWGKTNMVALLLEKGANIESKTRDGLTPLHCAARSGHEQVVDMLLERGAPISCKTKNGLAPLHMAAQGDHVDAARILLYHRAPVDEVTVDYLTALHVAAHCGHVRVAKLLLDRQADANARALNGFTPLHIACKKNRIKVVELLLKHGASISATTESGLTPLHVASFMGCMNIVIYLLQHDANPDVPTVRGETPLHLAARANQTDIIRILLRNGAQVDARAREQQTPLHIASRLGNVDIVMLLLQHGAKVDTTTKDMYTALHIAAKEGQDEVAAVLIENGASLNATTKKGFTPLHLAAKYGNLKVANLLLQKEAPVDAQGKNGVTPLHVASHYDHQSVALLLLDKGASPHATAKNGHTPLHIAARKNQMDIANTLLEYGAKPNAESKAGFTPLHLSAQEGHTDMSSLLIEHEADTNRQSKNGLTPLHLCAQEDRVPVAEILVKHGAEIDASTKAGFRPLHVASHYGQANMVRFLLANGANVKSTTAIGYTPLHQAAQQGHTNIVNILLENSAQPNAVTMNGQTALHIAQKLGYISVIETLKVVTETSTTTTTITTTEEKYKVVAPEAMQETFMSDSEEEGGEDTMLGDHSYRYLTADEMKSLGDDSLPIDVTRDERIDSNKMVISEEQNALPPQAIEDGISPQYITENYIEYSKKYIPDNVDIGRHPINIGKLHWKNFLVSFLVDARGGAMRGCRHSGVRVIVPSRCAPSPTRITCRYVRPQRTPHPPPLMEGEALASRVLELGPVGAKFLGPVIIEVPHFAALRGKEREIVILRSDNGETWREHTVDASEEILNDVLNDSFEAEDLNQLEDVSLGRITRIVTHDFPQYFAVVSRIRQEVHAIGPEGGMVSSTVVPQVQAVFPQGALTKKIKVGLQAQPIDPELTAKLLGHGVAVSPVVTVEPRRRKFHKAITLSMPAPRAHSQGMINQYSGSAPTLRLLCSITGGTTRAQWEDVTGSTPLTFVNDCVSFTTTVSARFWLMDCRNIGDATKMATELYREAIHVPFMAKFVVFAKRIDPLEARLRVFCMTDDKEDKTLEHQEHFTEVAKSRDVEVLEGKPQYIEFAGNLVPITKSGEPLQFSFRAFRENRLPFSVRVKDQHAEAVGRSLFMREPKVAKGEPPQQPICILNIVLPDDIVSETISLSDNEVLKRHMFLKDNFEYYRPDPRLADMSNLLGEDWVPLATQLGLSPSEINVIKSEYPDSVAKQAQSMLRMWISQSGNKAQGDALENALKRIGREDIIPQCLNVDDVDRIPRIPKEVMQRYQIKKETVETIPYKEAAPKEEEILEKESYESKYSAEEKAIDESDEEDFNKSVSERRQQIEKRLTEKTVPASAQRQEIVEEITSIKRQSMVEDKIAGAEVKRKPETTKTTTITKTTIEPRETRTVTETVETVKTTKPSDSRPSEVIVLPEEVRPDVKTTVTTTVITETRTTEHVPSNEILTHKPEIAVDRRDSELLEGVTQRLETTKKVTSRISSIEDPNSPKLSKTPPPSPADFIIREQAASIQEWSAAGRPSQDGSVSAKDLITEQDAALQESSSVPLTKSTTETTSETKSLTDVPKPKPRITKSPDNNLELTCSLEKVYVDKRQKSPVRDDTLDASPSDSYSLKKQFWESVSKDAKVDVTVKKRLSLFEDTSTDKVSVAKKRVSIHEVSVIPPVPKPRIALQSSLSISETQKDELKLDEVAEKPMTEYQVAFADPASIQVSKPIDQLPEIEEPPASDKAELEKADSFESEADASSGGNNQSTGNENNGYISDSGDVEHYISDSEIEDRVPQIRDRQMSVFHPSASYGRKNIYERSLSLPTEDLYDLAAKTGLLRKQYYEEQIRKEMVEDQLMTELEEEPSPEHKTLSSLSVEEEEEEEEEPPGMRSAPEKSQEGAESTSVRDLAKTFGETIKTSLKLDAQLEESVQISHDDKSEERRSVKDLARSFEGESGAFIMGQKVMPGKQLKTMQKETSDEEQTQASDDKLEHAGSDESEIDKLDFKRTLKSSKELFIKSQTDKMDGSAQMHKHIEESIDDTSTDITMQDFETSEELGSKELDEIPSFKQTQDDIQTAAEIKEASASQDVKDSESVRGFDEMEKSMSVSATTEEIKTETSAFERVSQDQYVKDDLSELEEKSDASKITYASDIEKDHLYSDQIGIARLGKSDDVDEDLDYHVSSETLEKTPIEMAADVPIPDKVPPSEKEKDADTIAKAHKPDLSDDALLKQEAHVLTHKPDLDDVFKPDVLQREDATAHKREDRRSFSQTSETHKGTDLGSRIQQSSTESEQSVFSERSVDVHDDAGNYKDDVASKPSDSMEVHVDKSEIEDSEKMTDLDQDATDIETKSIDSLNATEMSPKTSFNADENLPEITISLSGKQRRISEESEKGSDKEKDDVCLPSKPLETSESSSQIYRSEEHIQDTVWEVSVESQPQETFDERVDELTVAKQAYVEKDDELSLSVHDESDLGSEIHQDHSESYVSDKAKSDSHSEIEKLILESLHQQKISEEEAKVIASELLADIEAEIQKRQSLSVQIGEPPAPEIAQVEVSEYLRQLAETKGLDAREVELVQSVLARKQRQLTRFTRGDTQASSMEITDEDLKYSGNEIDFSPSASRAHILEEQIDQLEAEKMLDREYSPDLEKVHKEKMDKEHFDRSQTKKDPESSFGEKPDVRTTKSEMKVTETVKGERHFTEKKDAIIEEEESIIESLSEESETLHKTVDIAVDQLEETISPDASVTKKEHIDISKDDYEKADVKSKLVETTTDEAVKSLSHTDAITEKIETLSGISETEEKAHEKLDDGETIKSSKKLEELYEESKQETEETIDQSEEIKMVDDVETTTSETAIRKKVSSSTYHADKSHEETTVTSSKILGEIIESDLTKLMTRGKRTLDDEKGDAMKPEVTETITVTHDDMQRTFSDDSKSSQEETKSPEEPFSTSSSEKRGDSDSRVEKADVVFRKMKAARDGDTSSSSSILKPDRRSGVEFECYSSSGESHYQSFELDSGKSRPCSSDVEGLMAAGSSEYESALTSQDISAPSHLTSYHTAVSSLSSKESMKSLDSESSGNLASVEVSEASETLVPSEYESGDALDTTGPTMDDFSIDRVQLPKRQSTELSDSELLYPDIHESIDISEEETDIKVSADVPTKMKRSYEMTFQPEPRVLVPESPQSELTQEMDERFGTSLDDGSVLSVSLSSTSSAAALRTVIELSHAESERHEGSSMTISGTSEQMSFDDAEYMLRGSRESLIAAHPPTSQVTADTSTSTYAEEQMPPVGSVTITTSIVQENGIQSVSTQVTSQTHTPEQEAIFSMDDINFLPKLKEESQVTFDPKKRGHRRYESTAPFTTGIVPVSTTSLIEMERKFHSDLAESDKYTAELSVKEGRSDEKKDVDEMEKDECYETEVDQAFHRDLREGRYLETEYEENEVFDLSRPHSQVSKSDSDRDRITSTGLSDDRPDSELAELAKQCSSEAVSDPIERPVTPEPCDECEIKDDTPEFSSEAQASVGELEQEYTSAVARSQEIAEIKKQILTEVVVEKPPQHREILEKRESHGKLSATSSEKSSFEEAEAEAAFSMVAHVSPAHKAKQICPILEDEDAEKHELETRERAQKEFEERRALMKDLSPGFIPDIKVTQHMAPLVDRGFRYPDLELEEKDETQKSSTPQTPASSKSSESTDQGHEYVLDESTEAKAESAVVVDDKDEKALTESRSEIATVIDKTICEADKETASQTGSSNSDSFEMLEKPDLIDDFVVIEEVAKEASELDMEGKSVRITSKKHAKKHDQEVEEYLAKSAASPSTKLTEVKYYPNGSSSDELGFEFEDSPPQLGEEKAAGVSTKSPRDYVYEYDRELEANRKWIEEQFQNNQAAMIAAGYGYEMEFERGPLEDIKEEDVTDFDSSRIGSLSSQKESGGSVGGSVKDSYSSTPEYDVLAGRKYFTRSGDHDDVSMSSLQEFENLERAMSLENRRHIAAGSQESSSNNGSFKSRYYASRGGQGDDVSVSSLKEFEGLEKACIAVHKIEVKVKEEEAMLSLIDEGPESIASESESCETISGTDKKIIPDSDEEDYEKRMFEIDEIIRQAQSNVERFIEGEKTESLGRGDSFEEVAKVPDLDLDTPIARASKVQWADADDLLMASTDSLDIKPERPSHHDSIDSLDQRTTAGDVMTASTDSIEFQAQKSTRDNIMSDSIEIKDGDRSYMITSDSLELATTSNANLVASDSIDEDGSRIGGQDQSSSSTGKDFSSSVKEDMGEPEAKQGREFMLESTDSIASTSTATNATYQYETDSVFSGSFTSGGSNTMVSSTDTIDPSGAYAKDAAADLAAAVRKVWFDDDADGAAKRFTTEYTDDTSKPYVTEVIEPCEEDGVYSHTIHRRVELPPEVRKITFKGPDADQQLRQFIENFGEGEDVQESEHVDADGNVHVTRVVQKRYVVKGDEDDEKPMAQPDIEEYFKRLEKAPEGKGVIKSTFDDGHGTKTIYTQKFDIQQLKEQDATTTAGVSTGEPSAAPQKGEQVPEQATTLRAESEESAGHKEGEGSHGQQRSETDQQQLSEEMKELLKELERESKK